MEMMKHKYTVNRARSTIKKNTLLSKKMNTLAKKAVHYNRGGSYPFVFYGAEICSMMKGIRGGGVPTKAMQKLVKDHFDCKMVDKFYTSQICCD